MHTGPDVILAHVLPPADARTAWTVDPLVVAALVAAVLAYARGVSLRGRAVFPRRRIASFLAGIAAVGVALVSPLHELADQLFSLHMVQHLVLVLVAAPLVVYGRPVLAVLLALPPAVRRSVHRLERSAGVTRVSRVVRHPLAAWGAFLAVLWGWHLPRLYQAALTSEPVHLAEHVSFMGAALLFWGVVIGAGTRRRVGYGAALVFVFTSMLHGVWLAMLLSFAPTPLYRAYAAPAAVWGVDPLADQHLAGVLMWVPTATVMAVVMAVLFLRFFGDLEARMRRAERAEDHMVARDGGR